MKTINSTNHKLMLLLTLLLSVAVLKSQQVIGTFPTMDGGFEAQGTSMTSASYATGVQSTVWTVSTAGMGTFQTTSPRTGGKYVNVNYTSTTKRLQSPTVAAGAIVGGTVYTVQYYYRTAGTTAPGGGTQYTGASSDGTSPLPSMGYTTISPVLTATNGAWTKFTASVTASSSTNPSPKYGYLCAFRTSAAMAAAIDIDDVVMYEGAVDVTPPNPVTNPLVSTVGSTQQTISWTAPGTGVDGGGYMVVRGLADPQTTPNANGIYAIGKTVATGEQVVYIGSNPSFTDLGLSATTHYYYRIYTVDKAFNYSSSVSIDGSTTAPGFDTEPTAQVTGIGFTSVSSTGFTIGWTPAVSGGGSNHLVVVKAGSAISIDPVDGSSYTADASFTSGSAVGGGMVVYNGNGKSVTVTGLSKAITYYIRIYDFNGSAGTENYFVSNPASGAQLTLPGEIISNGSSPADSPKSYSDGSAWVGGIPPGQYDNVTIVTGDYLNVGSTQKCYNLTIQQGAKIYSGTAQTIQIFGSSLVCNGTLGDPGVNYVAGPPPTGSTLTTEFGGNLTISGSGGIYPYKIRPVTGVSNAGVTFASNASITYGVAGTLSDNTGNDNISFTVNNGVTLDIAGNMNTTSSVSTNGNAATTWNINGTVNVAGSFAPIVISSKSFTANINGLLKVGNLKPTPAGGAVPSINVGTGGEFNVNGGTCDLSGSAPALITGLGTFTLSSGSTINIVSSSGLDPVTGHVRTANRNYSTEANYTYSGTSVQSSGSDLPAVVNNLTINNSSGLILNSDNINVAGLTINSGAGLKVNPAKKMTVVGSFTNNGTLTLLSDATGTATLLTPASLSGTGISSVQQFLTAGRNWYISTPVNSATSAVFKASKATNRVYWYDEVHGSTLPWPQISDDITGLNYMQGYVVNLSADTTVTFTGNLHNGTKNIILSRTTGQNKEGYNLIGNPYPSYLDWDQAIKSNIYTSIWQRTINGSGIYVFDTYNSEGKVGVSNSGKNINNHIPPLQAFWVRVVSGQTSGSVEVDNSMRSHKGSQSTESGGTVIDPAFKTKEVSSTESVLRLQLSNGVNTDETLIYTNSKASNSFDSFDTQKMFSESGSVAEIYSVVENENLTINGLNSIPFDTEIPLGFLTETAGNFNIKASQIVNFESGTKIYLKDYIQIANPVIFDLSDGNSYTFNSDIVNDISRFKLVFHSPTIYTGESNNPEIGFRISTNENNQIMISGKLIGTVNIVVQNILGQCIANQCLASSSNVLQKKLIPGIYLITCTNSGKTNTTKLIIN